MVLDQGCLFLQTTFVNFILNIIISVLHEGNDQVDEDDVHYKGTQDEHDLCKAADVSLDGVKVVLT